MNGGCSHRFLIPAPYPDAPRFVASACVYCGFVRQHDTHEPVVKYAGQLGPTGKHTRVTGKRQR